MHLASFLHKGIFRRGEVFGTPNRVCPSIGALLAVLTTRLDHVPLGWLDRCKRRTCCAAVRLQYHAFLNASLHAFLNAPLRVFLDAHSVFFSIQRRREVCCHRPDVGRGLVTRRGREF